MPQRRSPVSVMAGVASLLLACANVQSSPEATGGNPGSGGRGSGGQGATATGGASGGGDLGTGGTPADGGVITRDAALDGACGLTRFMVERTPAEILLLLDRSASMKDEPDGATVSTSKWDLVVPAVSSVITSTDAAISWGYKVFPEGEGSECVAGSVTSKIDVKMAAMNASAVTAAIAATEPEGNGTPTGDAVKQATAYLGSLNDNARHYILLATDGDPSCPSGSSAAASYAVQAVKDAATAGINTFVVGIATTKKSSTSTLNMLANAGGVGIVDPSATANHFYLASTSADLVTALQKITGQVISCDFAFKEPPPVPENIAVDIQGTRLPQSDTDGWSYTDGSYRGVRINGPSCDRLRKASSSAIQITFGCPDIVIP